MRTTLALSSALLFIATLQACSPLNCEKGKGDVTQRELTVASFHGIAAQGSLEVRLTRGATQNVKVEGQPNLIDLITPEVKDGVWHIGTKKCYNTDKTFIIHITLPTIDFISVQGSGDVKSSGSFTVPKLTVDVQGSGAVEMTADAKHIDAVVQGSGDITLKGSTGELSATVQGSGDIDADELIASNADATVQGSGDIAVNVTGLLSANVGGSGDINYTGTPTKVNKSVAGSGEVKQVR